jgi:hypothetical protein
MTTSTTTISEPVMDETDGKSTDKLAFSHLVLDQRYLKGIIKNFFFSCKLLTV